MYIFRSLVNMSYKHMSGAEKRKRAKLQEDIRSSCDKITSFFASSSETKIPLTVESGDESCSSKTDTHKVSGCENSYGDNDELHVEAACMETNENKLTGRENSNSNTNIEDIVREKSLSISEWPNLMTDIFINRVLDDLPKSDKLEDTEKMYKDNDQTYFRSLKESLFYRSKSNGGSEKREWLVYDSKAKSIFCYPCKLFSKEKSVLSSKYGYSDWRNVSKIIKSHEVSKNHMASMCTLAMRLSTAKTIDRGLKLEVEKEYEYWRKVLKRIIATIIFLSRQGLAFRGTDENINSQHSGNYLSCLVYLAEFDSFLAEHLHKYANKGKGTVSYLSHQICDEFIISINEKLIRLFIDQIKSAKYYSIIVDSTPDISHCDQLTFILRYLHKGQVVERFLGFIKIEQHTGEYLERVVLNKLKELDLKVENCRGQSYDNASNMSGKYIGLQTRIRELTPTAIYIPCTNHSLNLVINFACESCLQATHYFSLVQEIYKFFSSSTHRWSVLSEKCKFSLKRLSDTRWSARYDAVFALYLNYKSVVEIFSNMAQDNNEKPKTRSEALSLGNKMGEFETVLMTVMWPKILGRVNATSKSLEDPKLNICKGIDLLKSLVSFIYTFRNNFDAIELEAKTLTEDNTYRDEIRRTQIRKKFHGESGKNEVVLHGKQKFKVQTYYVVCDSIIQELSRRTECYKTVSENFKCFFTADEYAIEESINNLKTTYCLDIDAQVFDEEITHFRLLCDNMGKKTISDKFELVQDWKSTFPNILTILEIFFTIPISNASGERSFSALKRIKNYLRSTTGQERLDALSVMHIESDSLDLIDKNELINAFAKQKSRKKYV